MKPENEKYCQNTIEEDEIIQLIEKVKGGDKEEYRKIIFLYQTKIFNLCYRFLGNIEDAEEAASDIFVRAYFKIHKFNRKSKFSTWLYRLSVNHCINKVKERGRKKRLETIPFSNIEQDEEKTFESILSDETDTPIDFLHRKQIQECIRKKISKLNSKQRLALELIHFQELSYSETSKILKCPVATIKTRLHRAFNKLKISLQECWKLIKEG